MWYGFYIFQLHEDVKALTVILDKDLDIDTTQTPKEESSQIDLRVDSDTTPPNRQLNQRADKVHVQIAEDDDSEI